MIGDIREHLTESPFRSLTIHMADGRHIRVPTLDHIVFVATRAQVYADHGDIDIPPGLLMAGLTIHASASTDERGAT